jgi:hypothetical protein
VRHIAHRLALLALAVVMACQASEEPLPQCVGDQCESAGSRDELLVELEGHGDPIAAFLRDAASPSGTLIGSYREVIDGIGDELGCARETEKSFVVLSNAGFIPKTVFTRCSDDPQLASRFFMAVPALHDGVDGVDVDPQDLHLSAWDEEAGTYRTYSTRPRPDGEMGVNVSPDFCLGCHGGPQQLGYWQPLMNEMTNPWSGWNAEPGFESQLFDELLDPDIADAPVYQEITGDDVLDSASNLEPIIRAGIERVNASRVLARQRAAELAGALALVRPLFCDETVNFVSEVHGGGELRSSALVDPALSAHYQSLGLDGGWSWMADTNIRLDPAPSQWEALTLVPVRGESTAAVELSLVSRGVLTAAQAVRVRALDWTRPVLSELRCDLFRRAAARIETGALDAALADLPGDATTADLIPAVYDEVMRLEAGGELVDLVPPGGADVVAVADAFDQATADALAAGDLAALAVTFEELGDLVEAQVDAADRDLVRAARDTRACRVADEFPIAPIYPDLDCP